MKKKLALLLVLAMILSAIPMNVFGATQIVRGPAVFEESNTYADIRVDVYQLAQLGYAGWDTSRVYDGSGIPGIPIEVELSDDGGTFLTDSNGGMSGMATVNAALLSWNLSKEVMYGVNQMQRHWDKTNGSRRAAVVDNFTGASLPLSSNAVEGVDSVTGLVPAAVAGLPTDTTVADAAVGASMDQKGGTLEEILKGLVGRTTDSAVDVSPGALSAPETYVTQWVMGGISNSNRTVTFYLQLKNLTTGSTLIPSGVAEGALNVNFSVSFYLKDKDAVNKSQLTVSAQHNYYGKQQLATGPAANFTYYSDLLVKTSNIARFSTTGFLDTLQVGEYRANYLNSTNPTGIQYVEFRFNTEYARLVQNSYAPLEYSDFANTFHNGDGSAQTQYDPYLAEEWGYRSYVNSNYPGVGGRYTEDFDLRIKFTNRVGGTATVADTLSIKNLMVAFDERMPYNQEVKLQYRTLAVGKSGLADYSAWTDTALPVVVRAENNVGVSLVENRKSIVEKAEPTKTAVSGRKDFQTEVVLLKETVPNSWNTGTTTFTMPAGVEIVGAHAAIYETNMAGDRTRKEGTVKWQKEGTAGAIVYDPTGPMTSNDSGSDDYVEVLRHQNIYNGASIEVNESSLTVRPMFNTVTNNGAKREIEVQFKVSVEAGFASEVAETIDMAIETTSELGGVESLPIALVRDPITATLDTEATELPTDPNFNVFNYTLGDINIVETKQGDLRQSSELWLYVVGSSNLDLNLDADRNVVINDDATTFAMYPGVQLRHRYGNFYLNGLRFDVQRASNEFAATGKQNVADFTIENVTLSGVIQPGAEYTIVISGSAVAENDYTVIMNDDSLTNLNAEAKANDSTGVFDSYPYELTPFAWNPDDYTGIEDVAPPVDDGTVSGPVTTLTAPKTFNAYSYSFDVDADGNSRSYNNFYMAAASNGAGYAGISPRAFGEFVGGPDSTSYDEATRTATITGLNQKTGETVVVELTLDSTTATVNGVSTDIAAYNNVLDLYPVGSIKPFNPNGRMYVPIRFLCNAFEVEFAWDDLTKSVTMYPGA